MKNNFAKIDQNQLRAEIIRVFGTYGNAADALEISQGTFSNNLKKGTPEFWERLRQKGVRIPYRDNQQSVYDNKFKDKSIIYSGSGNLSIEENSKDNLLIKLLTDKVTALESENKSLKQEILLLRGRQNGKTEDKGS